MSTKTLLIKAVTAKPIGQGRLRVGLDLDRSGIIRGDEMTELRFDRQSHTFWGYREAVVPTPNMLVTVAYELPEDTELEVLVLGDGTTTVWKRTFTVVSSRPSWVVGQLWG